MGILRVRRSVKIMLGARLNFGWLQLPGYCPRCIMTSPHRAFPSGVTSAVRQLPSDSRRIAPAATERLISARRALSVITRVNLQLSYPLFFTRFFDRLVLNLAG